MLFRSGDDVYTGSTKPAKYPRQDASMYEEAGEDLDEESEQLDERKYLERAAERVAATKKRANEKLEGIGRQERKRKESMEKQKKEIDKEREEERAQWERKRRREKEQRDRQKKKHHHVKEETNENIINQKLGAGEKKTALM